MAVLSVAQLSSAPSLRMLRLPRICVAVVGSTPTEMLEKAEALSRENPFIEFRFDYLSRPGSIFPGLQAFLHSRPFVTAIATCRRAASGGKFRGSVATEIDVLLRAADCGCQLVDVELQTAARLRPADFQKIRSRAALILSF